MMQLRPDFSTALQALVRSRSEILRYFRPDSCIVSTRVVVDALTKLGYPAEPVICNAWAFNRQAVTGLMANKDPWGDLSDFPEHSHMVGIDVRDETNEATVKKDRNGISGHLVAVTVVQGQRWLIDLAADQLHRQTKHIVVRGPQYGVIESDPEAPGWHLDIALPEEGLLLYLETPVQPVTNFRLSPNWLNYVGLVDVLVDGVLADIEGRR